MFGAIEAMSSRHDSLSTPLAASSVAVQFSVSAVAVLTS
jgi:hypothetical protein